MPILKETVTIMNEKFEWYSSIDKAMAEAQKTGKPVFLFFCSDTCFYCNQMDIVVYKQKTISDLIRNEFLAVRISADTPDVFRTYRINNVPAFIIVGTNGFEYERYWGILDADSLAAFYLLALGKSYQDRNETEAAQQYLERLISTYPQSLHAPEGLFLHGLYRYMTSQNPMDLKKSFLKIAKIYPDSIWVRRSLVLYFHPSAVKDWEDYHKRRLDYWESKDAFLKAYATYYNGPSNHQIKDI